MKDISLFVVNHRKEYQWFPEDPIYKKLFVGCKESFKNNLCYYDNNGENIAYKNAHYCELTGLYWIWKNCNADIIGLCHYRRFFSKSIITLTSNIIDRDYIIKNLKNNCMILPNQVTFRGPIISKDSYAPNAEDMRIVREIIKSNYPIYLDSYDCFLNSRKMYLYNMFVAHKNLIDRYCDWLFPILFEAENIIDKQTYVNDSYRTRLFGFISERLLNVWISHNNIAISTCNLFNPEKTLFQNIKYNIIHR